MYKAPGDLRRFELSALAFGALIILIVLSQWASDVFVIDSSSGLIINITWLLLEFVALVIGIGLTISPYILIGLLSGLIPRGEGTRSIQIVALFVTIGTVMTAVWLYRYYVSTMSVDPTFPSPLIFAVLPAYIFVGAGIVYGLVVLASLRWTKTRS